METMKKVSFGRVMVILLGFVVMCLGVAWAIYEGRLEPLVEPTTSYPQILAVMTGGLVLMGLPLLLMINRLTKRAAPLLLGFGFWGIAACMAGVGLGAHYGWSEGFTSVVIVVFVAIMITLAVWAMFCQAPVWWPFRRDEPYNNLAT